MTWMVMVVVKFWSAKLISGIIVDMFDKIRERYNTQINRQLTKLEEYFYLVDEETKIFNERKVRELCGSVTNGLAYLVG